MDFSGNDFIRRSNSCRDRVHVLEYIFVMSAPFDSAAEFSAIRHTVPLGVALPFKLGFSVCKIAPGLEIRECAEAEKELFKHVSETWGTVISSMHAVPILNHSHIICIDERLYGQHVEQALGREPGLRLPVLFRRLFIDDIFKMIVTSLNLFAIFPLYPSPFYNRRTPHESYISYFFSAS